LQNLKGHGTVYMIYVKFWNFSQVLLYQTVFNSFIFEDTK